MATDALNLIVDPATKSYTGDICPICSEKQCRIAFKKPLINKCQNCGHAFKQKQDHDIISGYSGKVQMPEHMVAKYFARYYCNFIKHHIGFMNINGILEIGSGNGVLLNYIRKRNSRVEITSLEPSQYHCQKIRKIPNVQVINDYVENAHFNRQFDLIIMSHVLEHLPNPKGTLRLICDKFLEPDGYILIAIPSGEFELSSEPVAAMSPAGHLHYFTNSSLENMLVSSGFQRESLIGFKDITLPANYCTVMANIARFENDRRFIGLACKFFFKAIRRLSLYFKILFKYLFHIEPPQISYKMNNNKFNNIIMLARKRSTPAIGH
jgi:SAM-dependent methyltransferase